MTIYDLMLRRRTIRKFRQEPVSDELLEKCVNAARVGPSGANVQPLEYIIVKDPEQCSRVFRHTAWAGYIADGMPQAGEEPMAYIFILTNTELRSGADTDVGIAAQNMTLVALEEGVASCMVGSLKRDALREVMNVPEHCKISLAVAMGYADEEPVMEEMTGDSIKYYRDEDGVLHVPKRPMVDVMRWERY